MPALSITIDLDENPWADIKPLRDQGRLITAMGEEAGMIRIGGLPHGMKSGKTSVSIALPLPDGTIILTETSLALFLGAAAALHGIDLKRWFYSLTDLQNELASLLKAGALVCVSPNRHERCDTPATRIFWQDPAEWYPCCDAHWPSQEQWTGGTRFHPGDIGLRCFEERVNVLEGSVYKIEKYDRSDAT